MLRFLALVPAISVALFAAPAHADENPIGDALVVPGLAFATTDRGDDRSRVGIDLSVSLFDDTVDATGLRFDLYGQYLHEAGYGGYAALPLSTTMSDANDELALGNFELGGLYTQKNGNMLLIGRAGIMLPTAADDLGGLLTNAVNVFPRLTDFMSIAPDTTTLRLSGSLLGVEGTLFYRADVGIDFPISQPDGATLDALGRLNVAVGGQFDAVAVMFEIATIYVIGDTGAEEFLHTVAVGARYSTGRVHPSITLLFPVDELVRQDLNVVLMFGVQGTFL